jgi:hypothetical protein
MIQVLKLPHEENILNLHNEGRIVRQVWTATDSQGRNMACLLAAMSPHVLKFRTASACPSDIMPSWLALVTVQFDDCGSMDMWDGVIRKYANLAGRWHVLSEEQWERLRCRFCLVAARSSQLLISHRDFFHSVEAVLNLLEQFCKGRVVDENFFTDLTAARDSLQIELSKLVSNSVYAVSMRAVVECALCWTPKGFSPHDVVTSSVTNSFSSCQYAYDNSCYAKTDCNAMERCADRLTRDMLLSMESEIVFAERMIKESECPLT